MKINQELNYIINFKPLTYNKKLLLNVNSIYCKNFFLFFMLLEFFNKTNNISLKKSSLQIMRKNKYMQSFLRAPNRYKKAQVKIELVRYNVKFKNSIIYNFKNFSKLFDKKSFLYFLNHYLSYFNFFESTIFFFKKKTVYINFIDNDFIKYNIFEL